MAKADPDFYEWVQNYLLHDEGCEVSISDFGLHSKYNAAAEAHSVDPHVTSFARGA